MKRGVRHEGLPGPLEEAGHAEWPPPSPHAHLQPKDKQPPQFDQRPRDLPHAQLSQGNLISWGLAPALHTVSRSSCSLGLSQPSAHSHTQSAPGAWWLSLQGDLWGRFTRLPPRGGGQPGPEETASLAGDTELPPQPERAAQGSLEPMTHHPTAFTAQIQWLLTFSNGRSQLGRSKQENKHNLGTLDQLPN